MYDESEKSQNEIADELGLSRVKVPFAQKGTPEFSLVLRRDQVWYRKKSEFVANGDAIFLDASSTALALTRDLRNYRDLTILTHSLVVA